MAGLLTQDRLKGLLLTLDTYSEEPDVITAWGSLWREFFQLHRQNQVFKILVM